MQSYDVLSYTTCNILCYFWYMCRYNVIWPSQCVNVCLLNCLNLFLKYKIGWACFFCVCVCVCVLGLKCLTFFFCWEMILRVQNVVWILGWVACLIAFMSMFFSSLKNLFQAISTAPQHLSTPSLSIKLFSCF